MCLNRSPAYVDYLDVFISNALGDGTVLSWTPVLTAAWCDTSGLHPHTFSTMVPKPHPTPETIQEHPFVIRAVLTYWPVGVTHTPSPCPSSGMAAGAANVLDVDDLSFTATKSGAVAP